MSKAQRLGLIALAVLVMAVAFVLARPGDDEEKAKQPAATQTAPREPAGTVTEPTATTDTRPEERIVLRDHKPAGGVGRIAVRKGGFVRLVVESDAADEIHLHGYEIEGKAGPEDPFRFSFRADIEGVFALESHGAEDEGGDSVIARLVVSPR